MLKVAYIFLEVNGNLELLEDCQWADWDLDGHLLVATRSGKLQVLNLEGEDPKIMFEEDLSVLQPTPTTPPQWATCW